MTWWSVEAWRGAAALLVVWAHWGPPLGVPSPLTAFAFTGVDLFFVISGWVFAPAVTGGAGPLAPFALRRVMRIYPAYLVALAVYVALAWQAGKPLLYLPEHLLMAHLQSREMTFYYNPVFWSLPAEVEYYALVPLLGWWMAKRPGVWPAVFGVALALRLALIGPADGATQNMAYLLLHHLPGMLTEFLMGVWVWQRLQTPLPPRLRRMAFWAGLLGWLGLAQVYRLIEAWAGHDWKHGQLGLGAAVCFACLLLGTMRRDAPAGWAGTSGWLAGRLSYGIYLLHIAWLAPSLWVAQRWGGWAGGVVGLVGLLASAAALHLLVEEPARQWGRRMAARLQKTSVSPG